MKERWRGIRKGFHVKPNLVIIYIEPNLTSLYNLVKKQRPPCKSKGLYSRGQLTSWIIIIIIVIVIIIIIITIIIIIIIIIITMVVPIPMGMLMEENVLPERSRKHFT